MGRFIYKPEKIILSDKQFREMVKFVKQQNYILAFYLYGSYGTEMQTPLSDVDLAILPMPGIRLDLKKELELSCRFGEIGRNEDINLINLAKVPVTLQMNVVEGGKLLYCRDRILLADFLEQVIRRYCDFETDLRSLYLDFDIGLREEFLGKHGDGSPV